MIDIIVLLAHIIIVFLLIMMSLMLNFWLKEHNTLMSIISHSLREIKNKLNKD